jgi:photoactive yellow protein
VKTSLETVSSAASASPLGAPIDSLERLLALSTDEVDELPYGFIVLDAEGTILLYNRYEAALARMSSERVLGRHFFRDVAPCTRVEAFFGPFKAVASAAPGASERFAFRFHFLHGAQDVLVQITRAPDLAAADESGASSARIFMTVVRHAIPTASERGPAQVTLDVPSGRLAGPLGPTFPLGAPALHRALRSLGDSGARELGRELGREIAVVVGREIAALDEPDVALASPQLVASALDDALAGAGLGRVALDFTQYAGTGRIDGLLRPPLELPSRGFAAFYEGLLGAALGNVLDRSLLARCLDSLDLTPTPWLFTIGPSPIAPTPPPGAGPESSPRSR